MSTIPTGYEAFIGGQLGHDVAQKLMSGYALPQRTAVRINPKKILTLPYPSSPVAWCEHGFALAERPNFALDPLWHGGAYYVQEAGSMAVGEVVRALAPAGSRLALDLCAAPGGKSTHLLDALPEGCLLVANEIIRSRVARLQENLERWGNSGYVVTNLDPALLGQRTTDLWDVVVIDAPCSGEGLFRKDPSAAAEWSEAHVAFCASRQQRIVADIWPALKPGGLLVYSTCTLNTAEDEGLVQFMTEEFGAELLPLPASVAGQGIPSDTFPEAVRFLPDAVGTEGQFLAAFRKPGAWQETELTPWGKKEADKLVPPTVPQAQAVQQLLANVGKEDLFVYKDELRLMPAVYRTALREVLLQLPVVSVGIALGQWLGKILAPGQGLATLAGYEHLAPQVELSLQQALTYLKKEEMRDSLELEPGMYLATYQGVPLGWLKAIQGGRVNNLLPTARRIRIDLPTDLSE
jgi:16S rRNA C967 or C1407 C5-methylase (RsmB/RsmF family)/NOL1/NOP2/fmu family ribosome biogenesis protein